MVEEEGPIKRWAPRRAVVEAEGDEERGSGRPPPVEMGSLSEDDGPVALPEPPPPEPDDDIRLPNPDRWSSGSGLPTWFFIIAALMILFGTLSIVWDRPVYVEPEVPEDFGER